MFPFGPNGTFAILDSTVFSLPGIRLAGSCLSSDSSLSTRSTARLALLIVLLLRPTDTSLTQLRTLPQPTGMPSPDQLLGFALASALTLAGSVAPHAAETKTAAPGGRRRRPASLLRPPRLLRPGRADEQLAQPQQPPTPVRPSSSDILYEPLASALAPDLRVNDSLDAFVAIWVDPGPAPIWVAPAAICVRRDYIRCRRLGS